MNETLKTLYERRSIRNFNRKEIPEEVLQEILKAGTFAPTGMGRQSPVILVIKNPEVRAEIAKENAKIMGGEGDPFYGAPVVLLVAAKKCTTDVYDGSCVIDNLMNAAWALGVGSCWIHRAKEEVESEFGKKLFEKVGLNAEDFVGVGHVALGYFDGEAPQAKPRKEGWIYRI